MPGQIRSRKGGAHYPITPARGKKTMAQSAPEPEHNPVKDKIGDLTKGALEDLRNPNPNETEAEKNSAKPKLKSKP